MSLGRLSRNDQVTAIKRAVYLIALPFAAAAGVLLVRLESGQGLPLISGVGLPLLTGLKLVLWLFFWRRWGTFFVLELLLFGDVSLLLLGSLAYSIFEISAGSVGNLASLGYWTSVLYTLAFLIFGVRYGLKLSLAVYLSAFGVWIAAVLSGVNDPSEQSLLSQLFVANGLLLLLLYTFGLLVERYTREAARHEADANTGILTTLPNRRFLQTQLEREFERAVRYQRTFSVVMLDIDGFKGLNDTFGHPVGDRILQEVAELLGAQARTLDTVGRWGGEEFLLLLPELPLARACEVAERFRLLIAEHDFAHGGPVTASLGVAKLSSQEALDTLLARVDRTLYDAKAEGRNRVMPRNLSQTLY